MQSVSFELYGDTEKPGFKTRIWQLTPGSGLSGWITDEKDHAVLHLCGETENLRVFMHELPKNLHPAFVLKKISLIKSENKEDSAKKRPFKILSPPQELPDIRPDFALCPDCVAEIFSDTGRRRAYPFWACAKCGGVYSAMISRPFLRKNTVLTAFPPCGKCEAERKNSTDSKHYASELLACPSCGPHAFLLDTNRNLLSDDICFCESRRRLKNGELLALQSLFGGFQLLVDAANRDAVIKLRKRKKMSSRPLGIIARDLDVAKRICEISPLEETLLTSKEAPILILKLRPDADKSFPADLITPEGPMISLSLPQTGQLHLLMRHTGHDTPPPFDYFAMLGNAWTCSEQDEQFDRLRGIADSFLCNDLRTGFECPPSVVAVQYGVPHIWRRSRGFVPSPIRLNVPLRRNAASFGCDVNGSVAIGTGMKLVSSQHLGNIRSNNAADRLTEILERFFMLFDFAPDVIACDMNSVLRSSNAAARMADKYAIPLILVQTHHAHALSCMAENGLSRALALVFDNGEMGPDGNYWGAELLDADIETFRRKATFAAVLLPGGENAISRPVRQLAGRIISAGAELDDAFLTRWNISPEEAEIWRRNCARQGRYFVSHAAMRLFDSVSAALGIAPGFCSYRGQASVRLCYAAMKSPVPADRIPDAIRRKFTYSLRENDGMLSVDWSPMIREIARISPSDDIPTMALAFHDAVASAALDMVRFAADSGGTRDVVLSGALFMNGILSHLTKCKLETAGFRVFEHKLVPSDGSGVSVGQLYHAGISN